MFEMARSICRGAFIVFEGCDRVGKTTQCKQLVDVLSKEGKKVENCHFPDRTTPIGNVISDYLATAFQLEDHAIHLLFSANRWEMVPKIMQKLHSGVTLIIDRYSYSGIAYSTAKQGMSFDWCRHPEVGLPRPDAVIYLTLSPELAASRGGYGTERYDKADFQKKAALSYERLKDDNWKTFDASKSIEDLHLDIRRVVEEVMSKVGSTEVKRLSFPDLH